MILTDTNFLLNAVKHYDNPQCQGMQDLLADLKRFKYIKRLLRRYEEDTISERLLLNHIIVLHNLFGSAATPMLFFKIEPKFWPQLKTFLVYLMIIPNNYTIQDVIPESEIPLDPILVASLRTL